MRAVAAAILALSGACSVLGPPPEYDYFVLGSTAAPMPESEGEKAGGEQERTPSGDIVALGEIEMPAYLDRDAMATRLGENQLVYSERNRWAEPLETGFARVLAEELERLLAPDGIDVQRRRIGVRPDYLVRIAVLRFEPRNDEEVQLWARWTIRADRRTLKADEARISVPMERPGGAAAAAASTGAVERLGGEIATALREARGREDEDQATSAATRSARAPAAVSPGDSIPTR